MTQIVPIDFIFVDRAKRQRRELDKIPELADSIRRTGRILHPPTIERSGELRVGERRWEAAKLLGWTSIEVSFVDDLDEIQLQLLELEENVARLDLPWQDECMAVFNYHQLQLSIEPKWSHDDTADALGSARPTITKKISVAQEILGGNTMVIEAPKYSTARGIVERKTERAKTSEMKALQIKINPTGTVARQEAKVEHKEVPFINGDFHEWVAGYTGPRNFNLIHCDFPYGVNADKHDQGQAKSHGGYDDSPEVYWKLLGTLTHAMENVINDSAHLMFWFSMDYYEATKHHLTNMGWTVNPFPLIWVKNDGSGILPDPARGPRRTYETAFLASRGDRKIIRAKANHFAWAGKDKDIHMSEKPVPMLKHFMEMLVDEYSIFLDPTAGSANSLKAANTLGASSVFGLERDAEFFSRAKEAYYDE